MFTFKQIINGISHPLKVLDVFSDSKIKKYLNDEQFLRIKYFAKFGRRLNLNNPQTFNEKMQWLKLYNQESVLTDMVDKYEAKRIVSDLIGDQYVIPAYGVWDYYDDIDFSALPNQFVIKTTHDCGGVVVCKDKNSLDYNKTKSFISSHLKRDYFFQAREWPYKNVPKRILIEKFVENPDQDCLVVYKVFCMNGIPRIIQAIQGDKSDHETIDYFDCDWNLLELRQNYPNSKEPLGKPRCLVQMLEMSSKLSHKMPFIRLDWYEVKGELLFSEFTLFSDAGFEKFYPSSWDQILGDYINLGV